ncbi:MAG: C10 family peptidase [Prevotella sp.]|nr:C10 family peptidase [Prevotella sp.]
MKSIRIVTLLLLFPLIAMAGPVDKAKALQIAKKQVAEINSGQTNQAMSMAYQSFSKKRLGETNYYVYNIGNEKGFVIVSGDDRTTPILGYSDEGSFNLNQMPDNIKAWMEYYNEAMEWVAENNLSNKMNTGRPTDVISPLLKTKWDQGEPYNILCPNGCPTGCIATAMAQVMNYHKYPTQETAPVPAYYCQSLNKQMPELPATTFEWDKMRNTYSRNSSEESKMAVAKLMQYCGQIVEMDYSPSGSGAAGMILPDRMPQYFRYPHTMHYVSREGYSIAEWDSLLINELKNNRPVLYTGYTTASEGHAFVCDGYDGKGLYHINWGWGGSADGYFRISVLDANTNGTGAGSTSYKFSISQSALLGVQPSGTDDFVAPEQYLTITTRPYIQNKYEFERKSPKSNFPIANSIVYLMSQQTNANWREFGLALYDEEGNLLNTLCTRNDYFWPGFERGYQLDFLFGAGITSGHYSIRPVYKNNDDWLLAAGGDRNYFDVVIDSLHATVTPIPKANFEVTNVKKRGKFLVVNLINPDEEYNGVIYLFKMNNAGEYDCIAYENVAIEANSTREITLYIDDQYSIDLNNDVYKLGVEWTDRYFYTNVTNQGAEIEKSLKILNFSDDGTTIIGDRMMCEFTLTNNGTGPYHHFVIAGVSDHDGELMKGDLHQIVNIQPGETLYFREDFPLQSFDEQYALSIRHFKSNNSISSYNSDFYDVAQGAIYWTADGTMHTQLAEETFIVPEEALAINVRKAFTKSVKPNSNPNTIYMLDTSVPKSLSGHNNVNYKNMSGSFTFTDGYDYYIPETIEVTSSVKYVRTFTESEAAKWSSLVIPFDVNAVKVDGTTIDWFHSASEANKDFWLEKIISVGEDNVVLDYASSLDANVPYLIANDGSLTGKQLVFTAGATTLVPTSKTPMHSMIGNDELLWTNRATLLSNIYYLSNINNNTFGYAAQHMVIIPFRVYISKANSSASPLSIQGPDITDGIEQIVVNPSMSTDIFSLAGMKVGAIEQLNQLPAGVYIVNGRKILIK